MESERFSLLRTLAILSGLESVFMLRKEPGKLQLLIGSQHIKNFQPIGDVNADGFDDILMYKTHNSVLELAYYYGSETGISLTPSSRDTITLATNKEIYRIENIGDFSQNGHPDLLLCLHDYEQHTQASAVLIQKTDSGISSVVFSFTPNFDIIYSRDLNQDDFPDLVVEYKHEKQDTTTQRRLHIIHSRPQRHDLKPDDIFTATSQHPIQDNFAIGDVNGDRWPDFLFGQVYNTFGKGEFEENGFLVGRAYVYFGNPTGFSSTPDNIVVGQKSKSFVGSNLTSSGDFNGDGYEDFYTGHDAAEGIWYISGSMHLMLGCKHGLKWQSIKESEGPFLFGKRGKYRAAGKAINGDGFDDLIISDEYSLGCRCPEQASDGFVHIIYGNADACLENQTSIKIRRAFIDAFHEYSLQNPHPLLNQLSLTPTFVGDLNGDGNQDFLLKSSYISTFPAKVKKYRYKGMSKPTFFIFYTLFYGTSEQDGYVI